MSASDAEFATAALLCEAGQQKHQRIDRLEAELEALRAMTAVDYIRKVGLFDCCPRGFCREALRFLGITDSGLHFSVESDNGNVGTRLQVTQGAREWDSTPDPL